MGRIIKDMTIADRLLFLMMLFASIAGIFYVREAMPQGFDVIIEIDGKPVYTYPLSIDRTISVKSACSNSLIEIKDKKVRVREASCPNQICVKEGWVSKGTIVCLPGKMVVYIGATVNNHRKDIDAITG